MQRNQKRNQKQQRKIKSNNQGHSIYTNGLVSFKEQIIITERREL